MIKAYFDDIEIQISGALQQASASIYVAVAWFTDSSLFNILCRKAEEGVRVEVIIADDHINRQCYINYNLLNESGGALYMVPDQRYSGFMHHKFCVIDEDTVISGSYNWSKKARSNFENITVTSGDVAYAKQFLDEFFDLKQMFGFKSPEKPLDIEAILLRFEVIKTYLRLREWDQVDREVDKLDGMAHDRSIDSILSLLRRREVLDAFDAISLYIQSHKALTKFDDPELFFIEMEIRILEEQLTSLENEKTDVLKAIGTFSARYISAFGDLIQQIINLRKQVAYKKGKERKIREAEQFEEEFENFRSDSTSYSATSESKLNADEKERLKSLYRKAARLCHPDIVAQEHKERANDIFIELKDAYDKNDLHKVEEIYESVKSGKVLHKPSLADKVKDYRKKIRDMKLRIQKLNTEIGELLNSDEYKRATDIADWDSFEELEKRNLQGELESLTAQYKRL